MPRILKYHCTFYNLIRLILILSLMALFLWYVIFQARLLLAGPSITLNEEPHVVHKERTISIEGNVQNVVSITLSGRPNFVDEAGSFDELLVLEPGYTIMTLRATDRYGHTTTLERSFIFSSSS